MTAFEQLQLRATRQPTDDASTTRAAAVVRLVNDLARAVEDLLATQATAREGSAATAADVREEIARTVLAVAAIAPEHQCPPVDPPLSAGESALSRELLAECAQVALALPEEELLPQEVLVDLLRADLAHPWSHLEPGGLDTDALAGLLSAHGISPFDPTEQNDRAEPGPRAVYRLADFLGRQPEPPTPAHPHLAVVPRAA